MKKRKQKIIVPFLLLAVVVGVGAVFALAPQSQIASVRASSGAEYIVTFKTIDGDILAEIETIGGRVPVELVPNPPQIDKRPFLRWTNIQGYSLDGDITANISFLPLYSYDPQFQVDDSGKITDKNKGVKKTQWVFLNYIWDETAIVVGSVLIGLCGLVLLFIFIKGVTK